MTMDYYDKRLKEGQDYLKELHDNFPESDSSWAEGWICGFTDPVNDPNFGNRMKEELLDYLRKCRNTTDKPTVDWSSATLILDFHQKVLKKVLHYYMNHSDDNSHLELEADFIDGIAEVLARIGYNPKETF